MAEDDSKVNSLAASPLSGGYLLVVLAEPNGEQHKQALLQRLAKGLSSWDSEGTQIDIESELNNIAAQCPNGEDVRNGEKLIQVASDSLVTEILIHPQVSTLKQCMRNLLASFTRHRHIVHAGYTLSGTGSWLLQDGLFEFADFADMFQEPEVQRLCKAYESSITIDVHCAAEGPWNAESFRQESAIKSFKVAINPADRLSANESSALAAFTQYISDTLPSVTLDHLLEPTDVVGNIRFSHPTLYVFPGGQGDSALFGISGFNILVDGGFGRKPCFWDFARHLDRLDAIVMTRNTASTMSGLSSLVCRKASGPIYPQVGHVFCNLPEHADGEGDASSDPLTVHLPDVCRSMTGALSTLQLKAQPLYRSNHAEPINLYHKVGHGTLDMYVISPSPDSAEVKELARLWRSGGGAASSAFRTVKMGGKEFRLPLLDVCSVCALLVWQPADPSEPVTRLLFPGSAPQHKILEGLEKLRHLDFLRAPVCTAKSTATQKGPVKSKSMSSPRHTATAPAPEPPAVKATVARKEKPKEANNKEAEGAVKSATRSAKAKIEAGRTASVELRPKKTETKAPAAKPAVKKEPVNGETKTPPVQKIKKDAANLKVVESRVHSFKSPLKRTEEPKAKKADDNKEAAPKATRAQSLAREKRSASSARAPEDDKKTTKPVKKIAAPKEGSAEPPSSPARKPLVKATKTTKEPAAPKAAPTKEVKKEKPKATPKPAPAKPKPASKEPAAKDPAAKAVKRPVKKPVVIATAAAATAVAAVAAVDSAVGSTTEEQPVVEEAFTATEVAPAASAPTETQTDDVARNEMDVLASIEDQIVSASAEEAGQVEEEETPAEEVTEEEAAVTNEDGEQEESETATEEQVDEEEVEKAEAEDVATEEAEEGDAVQEEAEQEEAEQEEAEQEDVETEENAEIDVEDGEPEEVAATEQADAPDAPDADEEIDDGEAIEKAETEETEEQEVDEALAEESDPAKSAPSTPVAEDVEAIEATEPVESADDAPAEAEVQTIVEVGAAEIQRQAHREMAAQVEDAVVCPAESASDDQIRQEGGNEPEEDAAHEVEQDEASNIEHAEAVPDEEDSIGREQSGESESLSDEKSSAERSNDEANQAPEAGASPAHIEQECAESIVEPPEMQEAPEESLTVGGEAPGAERKASTSESDAAREDSPCRETEAEEEVAVDDRDVEVDRSIGSIVEAEREAREHDIAQEVSPSPKAFESEGVEEEEILKDEAHITTAPIPHDDDDGVDEEEFVAIQVVRKTPDLPDTVELETPEEPVALKPVIPAPVKPTVPVTPQHSTQEDEGDEVVEVFQKEIAKPRDFAVPYFPTDEETAAAIAALQLEEETEEKCEKEKKTEEEDEEKGATSLEAHKADEKDSSKEKDTKSAHPVDEVDTCPIPARSPSKFEESASTKQEEKDVKQEKDAEKADKAVEEQFEKVDAKHAETASPSEPGNQNEKRDSVHEEASSPRDSRLSTGSANTQQSDVECDEPVVEEVFHSKISSQAVESEKHAKSSEPSSDLKLDQLESAEKFVEDSLKSELEEVIETVTSKIEETFEAAKKLLDHKQEEEEASPAALRDDIRDSNNDDRVEDNQAFESEPESLDERANDAYVEDKRDDVISTACEDVRKQTLVSEIEQVMEKEVAVEKAVEDYVDSNDKKRMFEPPKSPAYSETSLNKHHEETDATDETETLEDQVHHEQKSSFSEEPALVEASSGIAQDVACDRCLSGSDIHYESTQDALPLSAGEKEQLPSSIASKLEEPQDHEKETHHELHSESSHVQDSATKEIQIEIDHKKTETEEATADSVQHDETTLAVENLEAEEEEIVEEPVHEKNAAHEVAHEPRISSTTAQSSNIKEPRSPKSDQSRHVDSEEELQKEIADTKSVEQTSEQKIHGETKQLEIFAEHGKEEITQDSHEDHLQGVPKEQEVTEEPEKIKISKEPEHTLSACLPVTKEITDKYVGEEVHEEQQKQVVAAELKSELFQEESRDQEVQKIVKNEEPQVVKTNVLAEEHKKDVTVELKTEEIHEIVKNEELQVIKTDVPLEEHRKEIAAELKMEEIHEEIKKEFHDELVKQEVVEESDLKKAEVVDETKKQDTIATEPKKEEAQKEVKESDASEQPRKQDVSEEPVTSQLNEKTKSAEVEEEPKNVAMVELIQTPEVSKSTFEAEAFTKPKKEDENFQIPSSPNASKESNEKSETFEMLHKVTQDVAESPELIEEIKSPKLGHAADAHSVDQHVDLREKEQVHYLESPPKSPLVHAKDNDDKASDNASETELTPHYTETSSACHLVKDEIENEYFKKDSAHPVESCEAKSPFEPLTVETDYEPAIHDEPRKKSTTDTVQSHEHEAVSTHYSESEIHFETSKEQAVIAQHVGVLSSRPFGDYPASPSDMEQDFEEYVEETPSTATVTSREKKTDITPVSVDRAELTAASKDVAEKAVPENITPTYPDVDSDKPQQAVVKYSESSESIEKTFIKSEIKLEEITKPVEPEKEDIKFEKMEQAVTCTQATKSEECANSDSDKVTTQVQESPVRETSVTELKSEQSSVSASITETNLDVPAKAFVELAVEEETIVHMSNVSTPGKHSPSPPSPLQKSYIDPVTEEKSADIKHDKVEASSEQSLVSVPPPVQTDYEWPEPEVVKCTIYSPPDTASSSIDGPDDSKANVFPGVTPLAADEHDGKQEEDENDFAGDERIPSPVTQDTLNKLQDQPMAFEPHQEVADLAKSPATDSSKELLPVSTDVSAISFCTEDKVSPSTAESSTNLVKSQVEDVVEAAKEITESVVKTATTELNKSHVGEIVEDAKEITESAIRTVTTEFNKSHAEEVVAEGKKEIAESAVKTVMTELSKSHVEEVVAAKEITESVVSTLTTEFNKSGVEEIVERAKEITESAIKTVTTELNKSHTEVVEGAKEITESVFKTVTLPFEQISAKQEEKMELKEAVMGPKSSPTIVSSLQCDPLANLPVMDIPPVDFKLKSPSDVQESVKELLTVDTLDVGHSSAGSSASATPKSPLSPNIPPASTSVASLIPAQIEDDAKSTSSSLSSSEIAQHAVAEQKPDFRVGQEVEVASVSSKLSTIASSEVGADLSQPYSMDSNVSSATYEKIMASDRHPFADESAFSSGPPSWDERMMMQGQTPASYQGTYASDASATSSLTSHTTEDNHPVRQLDQPSIEYAKAEPLEDEASKKDLSIAPSSPAPSSPFSTDRSASHGDFEASKDSLSSIHTSGSSDYHLGRDMKVDDSASSARSDYSASSLDQPQHEERSVTPRSDISSASETTMRPIIQSIAEQTTEAKAAKVELADPKVAPHNVWIKEKEAASPNPFSDQFPDDDAEHSEPLVLDVHHGTSELYFQQHLQQQLHSDVESDSQSSIPVAEFTDEYYAQHAMYMEATRPVGQPYDPEAESYSYESDDHQYEAKYGDSYDEADQYPREDEHANRDAPELGDRQNGNSYHYYQATEISSSTVQQAEIYEDLNRNGHSPVRDPLQTTGSISVTESVQTTRAEATTSQEPAVAPISPQGGSLPQQQTREQHDATLASWGKPLGLPAPVAPVVLASNGNGLVDAKKSPAANGSPLKRAATTNGNKSSDKAVNSSNQVSSPFYVDLAYIPHHSDPQYADVEFFRRVRARHYVLSSLEPSAQVLDALLEGKQSWTGDDKELDVTIIPTYDSDALATWVSANEDLLARNRIDLAPSASRCTINLQDHETSCSAYRLEF